MYADAAEDAMTPESASEDWVALTGEDTTRRRDVG